MAASVPVYHPSLVRQLRRLRVVNSQSHFLQLSTLLRQVSDFFAEADDGRYTLERSIEISSNEMRALHDVLSRQASQDALTGLPNRAAFTELLSGALARRRSSRTDVAVLFIDLDGFKAVNDTLGHSSGDQLLVRTGERIRSAVRENDVVSRLGGDEFVVLCPDIDSIDTAVSVARRIAAQLESPYHLGVQDTTISASIGIAMAVPGVTNADEWYAEPTSRCTKPKVAGVGSSWSSMRRCGCGSTGDAAPRTRCARPSATTSSCCTTSRWSGCPTTACWAWRPWSAGSVPGTGWLLPTPLSRSPSKPG